VSLDALDSLMVNWAQFKIIFQILECCFDLGELDVELPQLGRIASRQIRSQEIPALSSKGYS
jgi:hypothetical protein